MQPSSVTIVAVVSGIAIGGGAALLTSPEPSVAPGSDTLASVARPFRPLSSAGARRVEATRPIAPVAPPPAATSAAPPATASKRLRPGELTPDERACARGAAEACLSVAMTLDRDPDRGKRSITFRRRAVVLYAEGCQARRPGDCHALSQLYEKGIGVGKNEDTAAALTQRYLELCKKTPTAPACTAR